MCTIPFTPGKALYNATWVFVSEEGRKVPSIETFARLLAATGSQLAVVEAPARRPSREELQRNGRVLAEVLELAQALPGRRRGELRYPRLAA